MVIKVNFEKKWTIAIPGCMHLLNYSKLRTRFVGYNSF